MIGKLSQTEGGDRHMESPESSDEAINGKRQAHTGAQAPPKIGKIRVHKSGKVVMRIQLPGQDSYVDLELNKGIQTNFYQELVSLDAQTKSVHFLAPVQHKIVATPDLDSILSTSH